jgi:PAS domain S-box-containing protein
MDKNEHLNKVLLWLTLVLGLATFLLGLTVLIGWYTENVTLIQILPIFVPMQYNTALGFILSGAGLLALVNGNRTWLAVFAGIVATIGLATFYQYIFDVDLGIDQLFMRHYITVQTSHPGRMAPNTAVCFSLVGIALFLLRLKIQSRLLAPVFSSMITGLGFIALTGYFVGLESAYGWGSLTRMAVHTSLGFIILGQGLLFVCWIQNSKITQGPKNWLAIPTGFLVLTITVSLWQALLVEEALIIAKYAILIFGLILAVTTSLTINFIQQSRHYASELAKAHNVLERKVEERTAELTVMSLAVEHSPATVLLTDPDGTIEYVNRKFIEKTGFERDEAIGNNPRILKSGLTDNEVFAELWKTILSGQEWRGELRNKKKNGELYWDAVSILPIVSSDGEIQHFVSLQDDITERKQAEQEIYMAKEAAEAANQAKSQFLAKMSHELRTPLNAVIGYSELLEESAVAEQRTQDLTDLHNINTAGKHLLSLIDDILDLAKIETGKMEMNPMQFEVGTLVDALVSSVSPLIEKNGNTLTVQCDDTEESLHADEAKLRQCLLNLLSNAAKFTEGGEIKLTIDCQHKDDNDWISFEVSDTGIGMDAEHLSKVMLPFVQADSATTRKYGGTGLGLAITYELIGLMGGEINVDSEVGKGSTLTLRLPMTTIAQFEGVPQRSLAKTHK